MKEVTGKGDVSRRVARGGGTNLHVRVAILLANRLATPRPQYDKVSAHVRFSDMPPSVPPYEQEETVRPNHVSFRTVLICNYCVPLEASILNWIA